jgi:HEAT repeat protein
MRGPAKQMQLELLACGHTGALSSAIISATLMLAALSLPIPGVQAQPPGPELFAKEPQTPLELWDAVDYLLRTGQVTKALPYLNRFLKSNPDDAVLIAIRDRYGPGTILRLSDNQATRPFANSLSEALVTAARKYATRPERLARFATELTGTPEEQDYAVRHLRQAGSYAVPPLVDILGRSGITPAERALLVQNIGRLERSAIPPLVATLDNPNPELAADAATALGLLGNQEAVPFLIYPATAPTAPPVLQKAAKAAIISLTNRPELTERHVGATILTSTAWLYHRHLVEFAEDPIVLWTWNNPQKNLSSRTVSRTEAEATLGLRFASEALQLAPNDRKARVAHVSITLDKAVERVGFRSLPAQDPNALLAAKSSGPTILGQVLKTAIDDGKFDLAAVAAMILGQVTDQRALTTTGELHPLVRALDAPGRRTQFAAAKAIVALAPTRPFAGSSRVVSTLARFAINQPVARAMVIDSNPARGSQIAGFLINLGYDAELEGTGPQGFNAATESADVELVLISFDLFRAHWSLSDTLAHLKADARTAALPIFVYGPLNVQYRRPNLEHDYPGIRFIVQPGDASLLQKQLKSIPSAFSTEERSASAQEATALLALIALSNMGPLIADLSAAEPALSVAVNRDTSAISAAAALGQIPSPNAQRSLAAVIVDPSRRGDLRQKAITELAASIQRFGPLVTADQEAQLSTISDSDSNQDIRTSMAMIIRALHAHPSTRTARPSLSDSSPSLTPRPTQPRVLPPSELQ